tara:strand:- start:329 stop:598 length:270 start_codon:yes stop_codon:yes gene_type:complete
MNLFLIVVVLQVADITTTLYGLKIGLVENNPIMAKMFAIFGPTEGILLSKAVFIGTLYYFEEYFPPAAMWAIVAIYILVVINNFRNLLK